MNTSAGFYGMIVVGLVSVAGLAGCATAEDQVVPRHPLRQLIVQGGKVEQTEAAPEVVLGRGKYRAGREQSALTRSSATAVRPVAVYHARPSPPRR
jgi:hypothetical protein